MFLNRKIKFLQIGELVAKAVSRAGDSKITSVNDILETDRAAREFVLSEYTKL